MILLNDMIWYEAGLWGTVAPMQTPRHSLSCVNCRDQIVAAGGRADTLSRQASSAVEIYDPHKNEWRKVRRAMLHAYLSISLCRM